MTQPQAPAEAPQQQELSLRGLLQEMIQKGASDLHITVGERPKIRIDGALLDSTVTHVLAPRDSLQLAYSILTENPTWKRAPPQWNTRHTGSNTDETC